MRSIPALKSDFAVYIARPETLWVEREPSDSLAALYTEGYLPYSGAKGVRDIFYSARSARVDVSGFSLSSENRRIAKKFDGLFTKKRISAHAFKFSDAFYDFCLAYFAARHGADSMPRERLETIVKSGLVTTVVIYEKEGAPAAYVLEVEENRMAHFWQSFYNPAYAKQSLGLWLMLDCLRDAKERGLTQYYLGTVYGAKALYKTNFAPLEWWEGRRWSTDTARLKEMGRSE